MRAANGRARAWLEIMRISNTPTVITNVLAGYDFYYGDSDPTDKDGHGTFVAGTIGQKTVTYDFARLMDGATEVKCSEFGDALIRNMG